MGTFRVTIEVGDPAGQRYETVEAWVDTGAAYTTVPRALLERLGVAPHVRDTFVLADGRRVEREIGRTWVRVDGRTELTLVLFGGSDAPALLGAYTLEGVRLAPDPVNRRLVPVPGLLLEEPAVPYSAGGRPSPTTYGCSRSAPARTRRRSTTGRWSDTTRARRLRWA